MKASRILPRLRGVFILNIIGGKTEVVLHWIHPEKAGSLKKTIMLGVRGIEDSRKKERPNMKWTVSIKETIACVCRSRGQDIVDITHA